MPLTTLSIKTHGEGPYNITELIESQLTGHNEGLLYLFCPHTSCAFTISEAYDPDAIKDLSNYLKHLVPRDWPHYEHTIEGPDDSPSHIKSALLQPSLLLNFDKGKLSLGRWQGIFLCEFRDGPMNRNIQYRII